MATRRKTINNSPKEADDQALLFEWLEWMEVIHPELQLTYHVANEGLRSRRAGYELKRQGMKPGVPDICLPVARGKYHALYIEMKREKGSKISQAQRWWIDKLNQAGNLAVICHGFDEAKNTILAYLQETK